MTFATLVKDGQRIEVRPDGSEPSNRLEQFRDVLYSPKNFDLEGVLVVRLKTRRPELWRVHQKVEITSYGTPGVGRAVWAITIERWDGKQWREFYSARERESLGFTERLEALEGCLNVAGLMPDE